MLTISTLSLATAGFILTITSRSRVAFHSASWQQASMAAESAASLAVVEIRRVLPEIVSLPTNGWTGWTSSTGVIPTSRLIPGGTVLSLVPAPLVNGGEGNTTQTALVKLDAPTGMLDSGGHQWLRVRAQGTTLVPGQRQISPDKLDNRLRRLGFVRDATLGVLVTKPQVTRTLEMIVRPVLPFQAAILTGEEMDVDDRRSLVDSFDSSNPLYSTSGEYDSGKRKAGGTVLTNSSDFTFAGDIHGDVGTNGGAVAPAARIRGKIDNGFYQPTPVIAQPTSSGFAGGGILSTLTAAAGTLATPACYKLNALTGTLRITGGSQPGAVEVWVTGDITGNIQVDANVQAKVYVGGNLRMNGNSLRNDSRRAKNLQLYALAPPAGQTRRIELSLSDDIHAAIYAPAHAVEFTGNGDFMGSIVAKSLEARGKARFHFDEALKHTAGPIIDYKVASWIEVVR
jgi:hypothetical protein